MKLINTGLSEKICGSFEKTIQRINPDSGEVASSVMESGMNNQILN